MTGPRLKALALFLLGIALFVPGLGSAPIHLLHDEVVFALNAHSIAFRGQGVSGEHWPLYFFIKGNFWSTPLVVYFPALFDRLLPLSTATIRLPTALLGALSVCLTYAVGRQVLRTDRSAWIAAVILALTPAFFIHSRLGVDHIYPIPLLLASLWFAFRFDRGGALWNLGVSGAMLGVGVCSYMAAVALMPCYLALTLLLVCLPAKRRVAAVAVTLAGFVLPLLVVAWWLSAHPGQIAQQLSMYGLAGDGASPASSLMAHFRYLRLLAYLQVYHAFFEPGFLFFTGDSSLINSTRSAGVFLAPSAILMAAGANAMINADRRRATVLILAAFLVAPLAAVMVGEVRVNRALVMLPFAALIAAEGVESMLGAMRPWIRALGVALLILLLAQFSYFYVDYMGAYRARSAPWFEFDRTAAFDFALAELRSGDEHVALSDNIPWVVEHWRLHLIRRHREDLLTRTMTFEHRRTDPAAWPKNAVLIISTEELSAAANAGLSAAWRVHDVHEPDGYVGLKVLAPRP